MQHLRGIFWLAALLGNTGAIALVSVRENNAAQRAPAEVEEIAPAEPVAVYHAIGSRTCASTACHGSVHPDPRSLGINATLVRRDEYVLWSDHDPHARSLQTLQSDRSHQMFAKLGIKDGQGRIVDQRGYQNCLQCHATAYIDPVTKSAEFESISCEACHGPAEAWRETHYQRGWNPTLAERSGFAKTKSLATRANQCVQCHVGAADREVNHDLIAAGHPVLKFELAAYYDLLPKHWNDAQERSRVESFETQLWEEGQRQTMQQSLKLLEARLTRHDSHPQHEQAVKSAPVKPVWPEFAEYDCFACHHRLADESWFPAVGKAPHDVAKWNVWNLSTFKETNLSAIANLSDAMDRSWRLPDRQLLTHIDAAKREVAQLSFKSLRTSHESVSWDGAAQAYLKLAATFRARQDEARKAGKTWPQEAAIKQQLLQVRQGLAFPSQHDSPASSASERDAVIEKLRALEQQLLP